MWSTAIGNTSGCSRYYEPKAQYSTVLISPSPELDYHERINLLLHQLLTTFIRFNPCGPFGVQTGGIFPELIRETSTIQSQVGPRKQLSLSPSPHTYSPFLILRVQALRDRLQPSTTNISASQLHFFLRPVMPLGRL